MTEPPLSPIAREALRVAYSRVTTPEYAPRPDDDIRPATLDDIIGQQEVVDALRVALDGAQARGELPEHMLLAGPSGTGKTTLALCVANAIGGRLATMIGPSIKTPAQLMKPDGPIMQARANDTIFVDEIHRMWQPAQEFLFPIIEDGKVILGSTGQVIELPPLLFIGATTDPENLLNPMLNRFRVLKLRPYRVDELMLIAYRAGTKLGVDLTSEAAQLIAEQAEGIPRIAIRVLNVARDYAPAEGQVIDADVVRRVLASTAYQWRTEGRDAG